MDSCLSSVICFDWLGNWLGDVFMKEQKLCLNCGKMNWSRYFETCECIKPNYEDEKKVKRNEN